MPDTECPIQVVLMGSHPVDCTFPRGHEPPHSWAIPGASVFVMAPRASDLRNRDGGDVVTAEERQAALDYARRAAADAGLVAVDPDDVRAVLEVVADSNALRDALTGRQDRAAMRLSRAAEVKS